MALTIIDLCVNCWACESVCPNDAIRDAKPHFEINPAKCTECDGDHADPQCASICPIEGAILDAAGEAINPPGSLTGIPPEHLAAMAAAYPDGKRHDWDSFFTTETRRAQRS